MTITVLVLTSLIASPAIAHPHFRGHHYYGQRIDGTCGTSSGQTLSAVPTTDLCDAGNATEVTTGRRHYRWSCDGIGGGTTAQCTAKVSKSSTTTTPVNGTCGMASGQTLNAAPTTNLCGEGVTASAVTGTGPWTWNCDGMNGGNTAQCSAALQGAATNSACGSYSSGSTYTLTTSSTSGTTPATTAQCPNGGTVPTLTVVTQQYTCANGVQTAKGSPISTTTNAAAVCNSSGGGQACPALAKLCPDGSSVSATGPNCTFPACPSAGSSCGTYASGTTWTTTVTVTGTTAATAAQCPAGGTVPTSTTTTTTYACTNGTQSVTGTPKTNTTVTGTPLCVTAASCGTHASGSTYTVQTSQTTGAEAATAAQCPNGGTVPTLTTVTQQYTCNNGTQTTSGSPTTTTTTGSPTCAAAASCGSYASGSTYVLTTSSTTGTATATTAQCPNGGTVPTLTTVTQQYTCNNGTQTANGSPATSITDAGPAVCASVTGTRKPWNQPFSNDSVWNTPIGSGAQWSNPSTDGGTAQLVTVNGYVNAIGWGQPWYIGQSTDPIVTVSNTDTLYPVPVQTPHVPASAVPAPPSDSSGDHHMAFFDMTQPTIMWSYYACSFNNGSNVTGGVSCGLGGVWNACGDGITNTVAPGSDYNFAIGTIRHWELQAGTIQHVLRYASSTDLARSPGPTWTDNIPWPDTHEDYNGPSAYTGNLDAGLTIGIPASVNLNSLGLSTGGMMLAQALQQYGAIWRDTGGNDQITFYAEPQDESNSLINQMRGDMGKIVPQLRVLLNQGPSSINGGGTPLIAGPAALDPTICP